MPGIKSAALEPHSYHHGDLRRSLIEAGCALLRQDQNWNFSLREVARRANVSHNAPYNHFADRQDLLAAVAAVGFEELRQSMQASVAGIENPKTALIKSACAYVNFGLENPARYRLMFASALRTSAETGSPLEIAATSVRAILGEIIHRGARAGVFAVSPRKKEDLETAHLAAWSTVHGLTMLLLDGLAPKLNDAAERCAPRNSFGLFRK